MSSSDGATGFGGSGALGFSAAAFFSACSTTAVFNSLYEGRELALIPGGMPGSFGFFAKISFDVVFVLIDCPIGARCGLSAGDAVGAIAFGGGTAGGAAAAAAVGFASDTGAGAGAGVGTGAGAGSGFFSGSFAFAGSGVGSGLGAGAGSGSFGISFISSGSASCTSGARWMASMRAWRFSSSMVRMRSS